MGTNNKGWVDPNYEGKVLRKLIKKVVKMLEKGVTVTVIDPDEHPEGLGKEAQVTHAIGEHYDKVIKGIHCISQAAMSKNSLAKSGEMQKDIDMIKDHLGIK